MVCPVPLWPVAGGVEWQILQSLGPPVIMVLLQAAVVFSKWQFTLEQVARTGREVWLKKTGLL